VSLFEVTSVLVVIFRLRTPEREKAKEACRFGIQGIEDDTLRGPLLLCRSPRVLDSETPHKGLGLQIFSKKNQKCFISGASIHIRTHKHTLLLFKNR
jgi:hypothetical protein